MTSSWGQGHKFASVEESGLSENAQKMSTWPLNAKESYLFRRLCMKASDVAKKVVHPFELHR
jgi:hypothetical protein